ncbi:peptidoglycan-binding protein [Streptomyces mirabilis]|uniref:peptidoglycan-binding domain-containing protein n=1 Tax=Streptomyces mirabilis TaxID=68239 RepID=UPI0036CF1AA3
MNARTRIAVVAATTALLGSGLALGSAEAVASAAPQGRSTATAQQDSGALAACPKGGSYKWKKLAGGKWGWTANYSNTMSAVIGKRNQGNNVYEAQCMLRGWGYQPGTVDGVFGSKTQAAVVKFQKAKHIAHDGIVGKETWKYLRSG